MTDYLDTPNIPNRAVKCVIADYRINPESVDKLYSLGIKVIHTTAIKSIDDAVNGHPDMQIHHLGGNRFVCAKEAYRHYRTVLPEDAELICGSHLLKKQYPGDILYNTAVIGDYAVCNKKYTAKEIISKYSDIIDVRQGYAKCSIAVVGERAAITSDIGIYKALTEHKIDTLLIDAGEIQLEGMSYGFIGGVCGLIAPDVLAVNGNLKMHSGYKEILNFCESHFVKILELNRETLCDIGSILPVY